MHTLPPPDDNPPLPGHRPVLPPPHWAVIDAHEDQLGVPAWPLPL